MEGKLFRGNLEGSHFEKALLCKREQAVLSMNLDALSIEKVCQYFTLTFDRKLTSYSWVFRNSGFQNQLLTCLHEDNSSKLTSV